MKKRHSIVDFANRQEVETLNPQAAGNLRGGEKLPFWTYWKSIMAAEWERVNRPEATVRQEANNGGNGAER